MSEVGHLMTEVYDLHRELARLGWIANDFYDGAMIYDFRRRRVHVIDLDSYNMGSFTNSMGRMFGSSRFMAPEEFELGATIDERTTVFTMGTDGGGADVGQLAAEGRFQGFRRPVRRDGQVLRGGPGRPVSDGG